MKQTKADKIRSLAKEHGHYHSNGWFRKTLMSVYGEEFSVQQISQVLGRMRERELSDLASVHQAARAFICACGNDLGLVKKVVASYELPELVGGAKK